MNDIIPQDAPQKQCTKCKKVFPASLEFFSPRADRKPGSLQSACKACAAARMKARRQNPDDYSHSQEYKEKKRLYDQEYSKSHAEQHREAGRRYCQNNREKHRESYNRDYHAHIDERRLHGRIRSHRRRANTGGQSHTRHDIQAQYERQRGYCYYCKARLNKTERAWHIDHIIPLSRGGSNDPSNLVIACPTCNRKKHDKLPHEWPEGGRLI